MLYSRTSDTSPEPFTRVVEASVEGGLLENAVGSVPQSLSNFQKSMKNKKTRNKNIMTPSEFIGSPRSRQTDQGSSGFPAGTSSFSNGWGQ